MPTTWSIKAFLNCHSDVLSPSTGQRAKLQLAFSPLQSVSLLKRQKKNFCLLLNLQNLFINLKKYIEIKYIKYHLFMSLSLVCKLKGS